MDTESETATPAAAKPSGWTLQKKLLVSLVSLWIAGKVLGWIFAIPGPWGPSVGDELPSGDQVYFQSRQVGSQNEDRLIWIPHKGLTKYYQVESATVAFEFVTLRFQGTDKVWVECEGQVAAALDLAAGELYGEGSLPHWAQYEQGEMLDEGITWSIFQILAPW